MRLPIPLAALSHATSDIWRMRDFNYQLPKDQIQEFIEGLLPDTRLIIEPKIDGCAIALQYRDGILEKAISRKGTDCTNKISAVPDVPSNIKIKGLFQVRG